MLPRDECPRIKFERLGVPRDVTPSAKVRQVTAALGEMEGLARMRRAAAGVRNAMLWNTLRTRVLLQPPFTSLSASIPASHAGLNDSFIAHLPIADTMCS